MVVEYTPGVIQGSMKENGEQTKCMAKGFLVGLTEENILENTMKIKRKDLENLFFKTDEDIVENGLTVNKLEKVH